MSRRPAVLLILLPIVLSAAACAEAPPAQPPAPDLAPAGPPAADVVAAWLTGTFDSRAQAAADMRYREIALRICPVELPAYGARVLYVEQAVVGNAPYRQRVYVVDDDGGPGRAVSRVFELARPSAVVGLCDAPAGRTIADGGELTERVGCAVHLVASEDGAAFAGGTDGRGCASALSGATYATSEVTLTATKLRSWDRGFDDAGRQVWGATAGPYEFLRAR
jgi:hypothetical protein